MAATKIQTDKNGLQLSSNSDSGYKFVTTFFEGPLQGKFIAFADVTGDERQYKNSQLKTRVPGFFGFKNVMALGVYDDVRDAAFVGQNFYGEDSSTRNDNLDMIFEGSESVIPTPRVDWKHDPNYDQIEGARKRALKRNTNRVGKLDVQGAIAKFFKDSGADYNVGVKDAPAIREAMNDYLDTLGRSPKNNDLMKAAELAFEEYRK